MHVLKTKKLELSKLTAHESSPAQRRITEEFKLMFLKYTPSHYFDSEEKKLDGFSNINLEAQDFPSEMFDVFICLDVMEHVFNPKLAFREIYRTLKPNGIAIMTFPINKG
jgi:SAM-dependent methyltransferase